MRSIERLNASLAASAALAAVISLYTAYTNVVTPAATQKYGFAAVTDHNDFSTPINLFFANVSNLVLAADTASAFERDMLAAAASRFSTAACRNKAISSFW